MRLLNVKTRKLERFFDESNPDHAILSHTWGAEEVTLQDLENPDHVQKKGWTKSNSAFRRSRWFTRGWTLQELIAPRNLVFYDQKWKPMGTRLELAALVKDITAVPAHMLSADASKPWPNTAIRMSWAANRAPSRAEDIAYCLLGIFDIQMPLLYGEGNAAFQRLQLELLKQSEDESLLAWGLDSSVQLIIKPPDWRVASEIQDASHQVRVGDNADLLLFPLFLQAGSGKSTITYSRGQNIICVSWAVLDQAEMQTIILSTASDVAPGSEQVHDEFLPLHALQDDVLIVRLRDVVAEITMAVDHCIARDHGPALVPFFVSTDQSLDKRNVQWINDHDHIVRLKATSTSLAS
ncbi:Vegetative incompatibility protein HET-E-1 like [Verticillium longisporum]|nr:Vegetative incompatibility protein HET-E-1 like [Verticillium longisporum]